MRATIGLVLFLFIGFQAFGQETFLLNGSWEFGEQRNYRGTTQVPSVTFDPTRMNDSTVWYRKQIHLPRGNWSQATLVLKGARFSPQVYLNGDFIGGSEGGMAPVSIRIDHREIKPGATVLLEVALQSLKATSSTDASYIPEADHWRSNISSYIWDDVYLRLHGPVALERVIPFTDMENDLVHIRYTMTGRSDIKSGNYTIEAELLDLQGRVVQKSSRPKLEFTFLEGRAQGEIALKLGSGIQPWSPESPHLYRLKLSVWRKGQLLDVEEMSYAPKSFRVQDKQFVLNGQPFKARAGTVVWHRWTRDAEGRELAYDTLWFRKNVIQPLKDRGANTLRFHLGTPPGRFLDLCDRYGLAVQYEWHFFHGMTASQASLETQWQAWLDLAARHPSVCIVHPYNETEGPELAIAWEALARLEREYPPMVLSDRDVLHIHKYWWSLFENVGLYYDDADQFPAAIMVDEFGGNYLDGKGDLGGYRTLRESFFRFLGRHHTRAMRLEHQTLSNARIAEYWRRIDAAGFSPFCILGSPEDGNHWYLNDLASGTLKPVWNALTAAWSPLSVSLDLWDRHFIPGQSVEIPIVLFNDLDAPRILDAELRLLDAAQRVVYSEPFHYSMLPFSRISIVKRIIMPGEKGDYTIQVQLNNPPATVKYPVISEWAVTLFSNDSVRSSLPDIAVPREEEELGMFLTAMGIKTRPVEDPLARVVIAGRRSWERIAAGDSIFKRAIGDRLDNGCPVILLDVGPMELGQGYPKERNDLGPLRAASVINNPTTSWYELWDGLQVGFKQAAEAESHLHASLADSSLWEGLRAVDTWLFNGLRGGLIVPAAELELSGITGSGFQQLWRSRGLSDTLYVDQPFYAYELEGFYEYSGFPGDQQAVSRLRARVRFLVEDAPALAGSISPDKPVVETDLHQAYQKALHSGAMDMIALASAGKDLKRSPVYLIKSEAGKGNLIISQLITAGRLAPGFGQDGFYGLRYDAVARQLVLNMIRVALDQRIDD